MVRPVCSVKAHNGAAPSIKYENDVGDAHLRPRAGDTRTIGAPHSATAPVFSIAIPAPGDGAIGEVWGFSERCSQLRRRRFYSSSSLISPGAPHSPIDHRVAGRTVNERGPAGGHATGGSARRRGAKHRGG